MGNSMDMIQDRIRYLRENTDFVSTLFERLIGYAIIAADFDGNIIAYNEGARLIYGYALEEVIGKEIIEIFFPKEFIEAGELENIIKELIDKGSFSYEGEKVRKDGSRFPAQILFTLTKDRNGKVVGFVEIVEDLTEQKKAEKAEAERVAQLEKELRSLAQLSSPLKTSITAKMFGVAPFREGLPETFNELVSRYEGIMDMALEQRAYKVEHNISDRLSSIAENMGLLKVGPRDVVELHTTALKEKTKGLVHEKAKAYTEEGRLLVLELMGYLVSFYRNHAYGVSKAEEDREMKNETHMPTSRHKGE